MAGNRRADCEIAGCGRLRIASNRILAARRKTRRDPFATAELGNAGFPAWPIQNDADFLFHRMTLARCPTFAGSDGPRAGLRSENRARIGAPITRRRIHARPENPSAAATRVMLKSVLLDESFEIVGWKLRRDLRKELKGACDKNITPRCYGNSAVAGAGIRRLATLRRARSERSSRVRADNLRQKHAQCR